MTICLPLDDPDNLWSYCPSLGAAILFSFLYGITTAVHIFQAIKYRKRFCWVLIMGALWETLSSIFRCFAIQNPTSQGVYDPHFLLILLAPLWINAFDYMLLGRMVNFWLPDKKLRGIKAKRIGILFVLLDIASFIVQLAGGLLTVGTPPFDVLQNGLHIYTAGIALQALVIICFLGLSILFRRRLLREAPETDAANGLKLLRIVYVSLGLILFRIFYRVIEFSAGAGTQITRTIQDYEVFVYVFDNTPMFFALVLFNVFHPGTILVGPESEFPKKTKAEKKAAKEEKKRLKLEKKELKEEEKRTRLENGVGVLEMERMDEA